MDAMNVYLIKVVMRLEARRVAKAILTNVICVVSSVLIIALVVSGIRSHDRREAMNNMLHSPNFTGVVISRNYLTEYFRIAIPRGYSRTTYRLRILGVYVDGDERMPIDQYFIVSEEMFHRFQIGDVFNNIPPPEYFSVAVYFYHEPHEPHEKIMYHMLCCTTNAHIKSFAFY